MSIKKTKEVENKEEEEMEGKKKKKTKKKKTEVPEWGGVGTSTTLTSLFLESNDLDMN